MRVREKERQNRQVYKEEKMNRFRNSIFSRCTEHQLILVPSESSSEMIDRGESLNNRRDCEREREEGAWERERETSFVFRQKEEEMVFVMFVSFLCVIWEGECMCN